MSFHIVEHKCLINLKITQISKLKPPDHGAVDVNESFQRFSNSICFLIVVQIKKNILKRKQCVKHARE